MITLLCSTLGIKGRKVRTLNLLFYQKRGVKAAVANSNREQRYLVFFEDQDIAKPRESGTETKPPSTFLKKALGKGEK